MANLCTVIDVTTAGVDESPSRASLPAESKPVSERKHLRASYDIARTSNLNEAQWAGADNSDSDRANSPAVRQLARNRSRHETDNNPSLKGIVRTITHFEIGTGPTLHVDDDDEDYSSEVEAKWSEWCEATNLPGKLRSMVNARVVDGESFARIGVNPNLANEVKLDFQPFECDRCYTLWLPYLTPYRIDGVWFDTWGNPTYYDILQYHPGGVFPMPTWKFDTVPAQYVLHLFNPERPGQHRGMPEMSSSTDLWADRRLHRKATVLAAQTSAKIGLAVETNNPPGAEASERPDDYSPTSIPMGSMFMLPDGWHSNQIRAEHPAQTYEMFAAETLNEAARPMSLALNVAKCDSSRYNFAGGRLDIITSWKAVETHQSNNTWCVVNPLFRAWYAEARLVYNWATKDGGKIPGHLFYWVGMPYADPEAEQAADESAVTTGLRGIQEIYARRGKDWKIQKRLNAKALGLTDDKYDEWIRNNLTRSKGGEGGDKGTAQQPKPGAGKAPEKIAAEWKAYHTRVLARMNGDGHALQAAASAGEVSDLVRRLFEARQIAHVKHLEAHTLTDHEALGNFYEALLEQIDQFIECYQGQFGIVAQQSQMSVAAVDSVAFLREFAALVSEWRPQFDTHLQAIMDEMLATTYRTLYKLRFLSEQTEPSNV